MTLCNISVLNGAKRIVTEDIGHTELIVAWFGGTTFNVYITTPEGTSEPLDERTVFSLSDENGEPVDSKTAENHMKEWLENNE